MSSLEKRDTPSQTDAKAISESHPENKTQSTVAKPQTAIQRSADGEGRDSEAVNTMGPGFGLFSKLSTRGKLSVGWGNRDYDVFSFDSTKTHPPHCDAEKAEEKKDRKQIENEE